MNQSSDDSDLSLTPNFDENLKKQDDIHLDENENYVGKQNFCSVSDLSCLEIYPFLDMELEQEIISGDIFSLPEENWNHLDGVMTRESVLIKESWMKQGINPLRCDAMMPNQAACRPFNRNKTSAVDPGRQFMRLVIKNDGMCSVGSKEVKKVDHSRYHRSKKKKLKEPEHAPTNMFEMSKQNRGLKDNKESLEYNRKSPDINLLSGSEPRNQAYTPSNHPRKFQVRNIESLLLQYNDAPSSPEYDKQKSKREQIFRVRIEDGFRPDEIKKCGDETRDGEQQSKRKEHNNAEKLRRIHQAKSFKDLSCQIPDFYNSGKDRSGTSKIRILTAAKEHCLVLQRTLQALESELKLEQRRNLDLLKTKKQLNQLV